MVMPAQAGDDDVHITVPGVRFNLTDHVAHDDERYHVWRFDDSRRRRTRGEGGADHAVVARRRPGPGHAHVSINRDFTEAELPHPIAFLISVHVELEEPPL